MSAACPTKVFAVPAISPLTYNDKLQACHPWTMANHARTRILINKQRFSKNFHRFFRGRDSMKGRWEGSLLFVAQALECRTTTCPTSREYGRLNSDLCRDGLGILGFSTTCNNRGVCRVDRSASGGKFGTIFRVEVAPGT